MTINNLADIPQFAQRPDRRSAPARRAATWILVGLIHAIFLSVFILSEPVPSLKYGSRMEMILDLRGAPDSQAPNVLLVQPKAPIGSQPEIIPAPITIPPPPPTPEASANAPPGDLLGTIGQSLACGANNFENLNQAQRARCRHIPWQGARLPNGIIVLEPPLMPRVAGPAPQFRISGADAQRRELETSTPCPMMLNIPCLNQLPSNN